jgi:hypothetical protein
MQDQNGIYLELNVHPENGSVYVDSKHVPGLHLIGKNFQAMKPSLEKVIKMLFRDNRRMEVNIIWLTDPEMGTSAVCNVLERLAVVPVESRTVAA